MNIEVIGSGCPTCEELYNKVKKIVGSKTEVKYIKDVNELIERGIMGSPALVINGKVVCVGMPSDEEIKSFLK